MCSANNEPTELLFGDDLAKHVKDLTMTNKLKRSEGYCQSIVRMNMQKIMENLTLGSIFEVEGGGASQKGPGRLEQQVTRNINSNIRGKFKTYS